VDQRREEGVCVNNWYEFDWGKAAEYMRELPIKSDDYIIQRYGLDPRKAIRVREVAPNHYVPIEGGHCHV
jgi:hypothetical protein